MGVSCPCLTEMSPGFLLGWDVLSAPPGAASLVLICLLPLQLHELFPLTLVSCSFPEVCLAVDLSQEVLYLWTDVFHRFWEILSYFLK